jgi:hypothetical protein
MYDAVFTFKHKAGKLVYDKYELYNRNIDVSKNCFYVTQDSVYYIQLYIVNEDNQPTCVDCDVVFYPTINGTKKHEFPMIYSNYLFVHHLNRGDCYEIYLTPKKSTACECGANYTSFPKHHYDWCKIKD